MEQFITFFQNNIVLSVAWVVVALAIVGTLLLDMLTGIKKVSANTLTYIVNTEQGILVDVRTEKEYRAGHIVNSLHLLPDDIKNKNIAKLSHFKTNPIILIDANGFNTLATAKLLKKQGFNKISILKGGIEDWLRDNLPVVRKAGK